MPMNVIQGGPIPHRPAITNAQREAAYNVIAQLDYTDLWLGPGTLRSNQLMRVDMQGQIAGPPVQSNLQVQINGVQGRSTVAHAIVSASIMTNNQQNQQGARNKVVEALNKSLDDGHGYTVNGTNP